MQKKISDYIRKFISTFLCGYRKGFSTQDALLLPVERWKFFPAKQGFAGTLLMNLSKAFDTINHELIAKLNAYGFSTDTHEVLLVIDGKGSRSMQLSVLELSYFKEFYKDQFLVPYCLIFTSMMYLLHYKELIYVTLQMAQLRTFAIQT